MKYQDWHLIDIFESQEDARKEFAKAEAARLPAKVTHGWAPDGNPIHLFWTGRRSVSQEAPSE